MNKTFVIVSVALLSISSACAKRDAVNTKTDSTPAPAVTSSISEADTGETFAVRMERGACFGTCPMYTVEIRASGSVRFKGVRFVVDTLEHMSMVPPDKVKALREQFIKGNFASLAPVYADTAKVCEAYHTDAPRVTITLSEGGNSKTVVHDHGCRGAPIVLNTLEQAVDSVANVAQWMKPAASGKP